MTQPTELHLVTELMKMASASGLPDEFRYELTLKGGVALLEEMAATNPEDELPVHLLHETVTSRHSAGVRRQAYQALARLSETGSRHAVDRLYLLAVENDHLPARQLILSQQWPPSLPELKALLDWFTAVQDEKAYPETNLVSITSAYFEIASPELKKRLLTSAPGVKMQHWMEIVIALEAASPASLDRLVELYPSFSNQERALVIQMLAQQAQEGVQAAREAICLLFIHHEDEQAKEIALKNKYLPQETDRMAGFLFLAENWEAYHKLDFDHGLLTNVFDTAGRALRRRLMEHSRKTGQMEWLQRSGLTGEIRWIADLTDADWELAIRRLNETQHYHDLWRLAQSAPPFWSAAVLAHLSESGWRPDHPEDQAGYANLVHLVQDCIHNQLVIRPNKTLLTPSGDLTCMAVHPGRKLLAAGSTDQQVTLWDLAEGNSISQHLAGPVPVTRALSFSPDGEMITAATGDHRIRIYRLKGGQIQKTLEGHRSMIRSVITHPDGRTMYSAGYDGQIRFWRFPFGPELKTLQPETGEIFQLAIGTDGRFLLSASINGQIQVWALPEGTLAREIEAHTASTTHLAASLNNEIVASAGRDGWIRLWNYTSGGLLRSFDSQSDLVTSLCLLPNDLVLISGHQSGDITLWSTSTGKALLHLSRHTSALNGLAYIANGDTLLSSDNRGIIHSWDLRIFLITRLPGLVAQPGATAHLQDLLKLPGLATPERKWLAFAFELARWRQRYDIELAELSPIQIGEFDIELT